MDNQKFRKNRIKTYSEAVRIVRTSNTGGKILEQLKALNVLKEENHVFNRTVGIGIKSIYVKYKVYLLYLDFALTLLLLKTNPVIEMCLQTLM